MPETHSLPRLSVFIVILALAVLACQGVTGFNLFVTATPTATLTSTPTQTFTPTPSPTVTATATPHPTGMLTQEQPDGTLLIGDHDNAYQFLLPANWAIAFSSQEDLKQAIQAMSEKDPEFARMAEQFKDVDPQLFRLAAVNINRNYRNADLPTLLTVNVYTDPVAGTMPMAFVTAMIEDNILAGATSTSWDIRNNSNQVEVGIVRGTRTISISNGVHGTFEELVIAFQANKKLIAIEIATPPKFAEQIFAPFDDLIDSIRVDIQ